MTGHMIHESGGNALLEAEYAVFRSWRHSREVVSEILVGTP